MRKIKNGFTAVELLLALVIVSAIIYISVSFSSRLLSLTAAQNVTSQAYNYSQVVTRYMTTHQTLLRQLLSNNGSWNGQIATVTPEVLKQEGFIWNNSYYKNKLGQYPCTVIWYDQHQLQAFIYYRNDGKNSRQLDRTQLAYGLNNMGSMMGLYQNESVVSAARDWKMDNSFVKRMFKQQGTVDLSQDKNPGQYRCAGSQIANPSYVVNVTGILNLPNTLPKDDTIHQYPDQLHRVDDPQSNNRLNSDINMDYTDESNNRKHSNIVFQMNPNCQMDPTNAATMQDYDPNVDGRYPENRNIPNSLGCKNRQLAIQAMQDPTRPNSNQQVTVVTGFQQGGDPAQWKDDNGHDARPYVGEVIAASLQPTTEIAVGTPCEQKEIGTMARQQRSDDPNDVNNIYVSQVICMKSPVCPSSTQGYCYMPLQNVTLEAHPNTSTYSCPVGTFIDTAQITIHQVDITGQVTCRAKDCFDQEVDCIADKHHRGDPVYSDLLNTAFQTQAPLYETFTIPSTSWEQHCGGHACHFGCGEGPGQIADTQDTISRIQCTNDPSKAAIIIQR